MGPNNDGCIVWAVTVIFFSFFHVLFLLTVVFSYN
jgi:hypothetical protein